MPTSTRTSRNYDADPSTSVQLLNGLATSNNNNNNNKYFNSIHPRQQQVDVRRPGAAAAAATTAKMKTMREEVKSLQFYRAIIAECLAAFLYAFIVCGTYVSWPTSIASHVNIMHSSSSIVGRTHGSPSSVTTIGGVGGGMLLATENSPSSSSSMSMTTTQTHSSWNVQAALTSGFAMSTVILCFGRISGGHANPALTFSLMVTRKVTFLRSLCYIAAQCGGSIAGAALLYGVSVPGYQGTLGSVRIHSLLTPWQGFGVEVILAFAVVFAAFAASDFQQQQQQCKQHLTPPNPSPLIGAAYLVCTLAGLPSTGAAISPARALGPAFVMNRWENHWVYWLGPMSGGLLAGLIYEYIFYPRSRGTEVEAASSRELRMALEDINRASSSVHSQDDDYDDPTDVGLASIKESGPNRLRTPMTSSSHQHLNYNGHVTTMGPAQNINAYRNQQQLPPVRGQHYDTYNRSNIPLQHYDVVLPGRGEPTYGTLACNPHKVFSGSSNYVHSRPSAAESLYGSSASQCNRPPSSASASGNYATIHGNRPGGNGGMGGAASMLWKGAPQPHRLEHCTGPDSTKF